MIKLGVTPRAIHRTTFEKAIAQIREIGFEYTELEMLDGANYLIDYGFNTAMPYGRNPRQIKRALDRVGMKVSAVDCHAQLLRPQGDYFFGTPQIIKAIRWANDLEVPVVITSEGYRPEWVGENDAWTLLKYNLYEVLQAAEDYGVAVAIEPHGDISLTPDGLQRILDLYDTPWLKVNYDTGNVCAAGYDPVDTLKRFLPDVVHVHVKDTIVREVNGRREVRNALAVGQGEIDFRGLLQVLKDVNFDGVISVETPFGLEDARASYQELNELLNEMDAYQ
jgi:inosose dehydratase